MKRNSQIDEERLLKFGKHYLSEAFPNPDRVGCPPEEALRLAAVEPQRADSAVSEHLTFCSPCFTRYLDFLNKLREEQRGRKHPLWRALLTWPRTSPLRIGAVTAAVLVLAVGTYFVAIQVEGPKPPTPPQPGPGPGPIAFSPFTLDLRELSPTRAPTGKGDQPRAVNLPRKPLEISVVLPIGSEEGAYQLSLKARDETLWTERAQAHLVEQKIILRVKLNLEQFSPGAYAFEVQSASGFYLRQPIALQNPGAEQEGKKQ